MPPTPLLHTLSVALGTDTTPDAELLRRFAETGDRTAFELVVRRHAELVWRVCRLTLPRDRHAAEDAFQATFLALARRADAVRDASAAGWLFRVARNASVRARRGGRAPEPLPDALVASGPMADDAEAWREVARVVVEEVDRLTAKLRAPVVLCFFEGHTHAEAAARLGWPVGTVASRLARAKDALRAQLTRRGVTLPAAGLGAVLHATDAGAAPVRSALAVAVAPVGRIPFNVLTLTQGVLSAMRFSQLKTATTVLVLAVGLTTALAAIPRTGTASPPAARAAAARPAAARAPQKEQPDPKELEAKELKGFKGEWRVVERETDGEKAVEARLATMRATFSGNDLWLSVGGDKRHFQLALTPAETPRRIDLKTQGGGETPDAGKVFHGIYERNGDTLKICAETSSEPKRRPTEFKAGKGQQLLVLERIKDEKEELKTLKGTWKSVKMTFDGKDMPIDVVGKMRWAFDGSDGLATGDGDTEGKATVKLDPSATPPTIDLTVTQGNEKGHAYVGVYLRQENKLTICFADPRMNGAARPTELKPGGGQLFVIFERILDEKDELKALAGEWTGVKMSVSGKDLPADEVAKMRWVFDGADVLLTGEGHGEDKAVVKIDPAAVPPTIDLTLKSGPAPEIGNVIAGIYFRQENKLTICFADPKVKGAVRPTELKSGDGRVLVVFERKPKK